VVVLASDELFNRLMFVYFYTITSANTCFCMADPKSTNSRVNGQQIFSGLFSGF